MFWKAFSIFFFFFLASAMNEVKKIGNFKNILFLLMNILFPLIEGSSLPSCRNPPESERIENAPLTILIDT